METIRRTIKGIDGDEVSLSAYLIENSQEIDPDRTRPAVVILPGGGYKFTSDREAEPIVITMLGFGFHVFVLRYSVAPHRYPVALFEVAECIRLMRENAPKWNIDPNAIVVAGFSAGAHLAGCLGVSWNSPEGVLLGSKRFHASDIKPNGLMLGYPVITSGEYTHRGSLENLLGDGINDPEQLHEVSIELHITRDMPRTFLWHTMTDELVPVENSLILLKEMHSKGVSVEAHLFPSGCHGLSLGTTESAEPNNPGLVEPSVQAWPRLFADWMERSFDCSIPDYKG